MAEDDGRRADDAFQLFVRLGEARQHVAPSREEPVGALLQEPDVRPVMLERPEHEAGRIQVLVGFAVKLAEEAGHLGETCRLVNVGRQERRALDEADHHQAGLRIDDLRRDARRVGRAKGLELVRAGDAEEGLVFADADHVARAGVLCSEINVADAAAQQHRLDRARPDRQGTGAFDRSTAPRLHAARCADQIVDVFVRGGGLRHDLIRSLPGS